MLNTYFSTGSLLRRYHGESVRQNASLLGQVQAEYHRSRLVMVCDPTDYRSEFGWRRLLQEHRALEITARPRAVFLLV